MTTTFASRRFTQQPETKERKNSNPMMMTDYELIEGIYRRHGSPQKTPMQMFSDHQRLTCARLSVPHERRRRGRFSGTQNSFFFQTATGQEPEHSPFRANADLRGSDIKEGLPASALQGERRNSVGSNGSGFAKRVKTSLMGTSARQKLLKFKLAAR